MPKRTIQPTKSASDGKSDNSDFKNQLEMMLKRGPRGAASTVKPQVQKALDWGPGKMKPITEEEIAMV